MTWNMEERVRCDKLLMTIPFESYTWPICTSVREWRSVGELVERKTISGRSTGEQGGREYRMKPDLWLMYRLLMEGLDERHITPTLKAT